MICKLRKNYVHTWHWISLLRPGVIKQHKPKQTKPELLRETHALFSSVNPLYISYILCFQTNPDSMKITKQKCTAGLARPVTWHVILSLNPLLSSAGSYMAVCWRTTKHSGFTRWEETLLYRFVKKKLRTLLKVCLNVFLFKNMKKGWAELKAVFNPVSPTTDQ